MNSPVISALIAAILAGGVAIPGFLAARWVMISSRYPVPGDPGQVKALRNSDRWLTVACATLGTAGIWAASTDAQLYLLTGAAWSLGIITAANGWRRSR